MALYKSMASDLLVLKEQYALASKRLYKKVQEEAKKNGTASAYTKSLSDYMRLEVQALDKFAYKWSKASVAGSHEEASRIMYNEVRNTVFENQIGNIQGNQQSSKIVAENLANKFVSANHFAGRRFDDILRTATLTSLAQGMMQGKTHKQRVVDLMSQYTTDNILKITDKNGREIPLQSYANMVARTTTAEIVNTVIMDEMGEQDEDLVKMSDHKSICPVCAPLEGRVYSITGKTKGYPTLNKAFTSGYANIHPNCIHTLTPYFADLDEDAEKTKEFSNRPFEEDEYTKKAVTGYREAQRKKAQLYQKNKEWKSWKSVLGDEAPKTLSAFRKLKESNSLEYKTLQAKYKQIVDAIVPVINGQDIKPAQGWNPTPTKKVYKKKTQTAVVKNVTTTPPPPAKSIITPPPPPSIPNQVPLVSVPTATPVALHKFQTLKGINSSVAKYVDMKSMNGWNTSDGIKRTYGMIVFNDNGEILLREPAGHFGGYSWTFPKGGSNFGETSATTAMRETLEETGWDATLVGAIDGKFAGSTATSVNMFVGRPTVFDANVITPETASSKFVSFADAKLMIEQTTSVEGRQRDLKILQAAQEWWEDKNTNQLDFNDVRVEAAWKSKTQQPIPTPVAFSKASPVPPPPAVKTPKTKATPKPKAKPKPKPVSTLPKDESEIMFVKSGSYLGGAGKKDIYKDKDGVEYIFKPAVTKSGSTDEAAYKAYVSEAVSKIQELIDPESAVPLKVITVNGELGSIQKLMPLNKDQSLLTDFFDNGTALKQSELSQLQREHFTDWLVGNFDSHSKNFLVSPNGKIMGVDKEQAFRYMTDKKSLTMSTMYHPNAQYGENPPIYNLMYKKFANNEIDLDLNESLQYIQKIEAMSDSEYSDMFEMYIEMLHGKDSSLGKALMNDILERKNGIRKDYEVFYSKLLTDRNGGNKVVFKFESTKRGYVKLNEPTPTVNEKIYKYLWEKTGGYYDPHKEFNEIKLSDKVMNAAPIAWKKSVKTYSGGDFGDINRDWRNGTKYYRDQSVVTDIGKMINEAPPLEQDTIIYRHMGTRSLSHAFPANGMELTRFADNAIQQTINASKIPNYKMGTELDELKKQLVGVEWYDAGYQSASYAWGKFLNNDGLEIRMFMPKGYKDGLFIENNSHFQNELEYLVQHGKKFRIFDVVVERVARSPSVDMSDLSKVPEYDTAWNIVLKVIPIDE